jgi:hypothetical protein
LLLLQVPLYALNQHLCFKTLQALDMGGSITIVSLSQDLPGLSATALRMDWLNAAMRGGRRMYACCVCQDA